MISITRNSLVILSRFLLSPLQYGETPLHMAAKNGCSEAAQLLLAHGTFVEARANVNFLLTSFII